MFCCSVNSDPGSSRRGAAGGLDGGEDWEEAQPDVLLTAVCRWFHRHHRSPERVDALRRQVAHWPRQRSHLISRPGKKHCTRSGSLFSVWLRNVVAF